MPFQPFDEDGSVLSLIASFLWVAQLGLLIHVFKTGRPYFWFWVLLVAPVLGGVIYLLVEVLPDLRRPAHGGGWWAGFKPRAWRIRELREALEETDVVRTRLDLAEELLDAGQSGEAVEVAAAALQGVWRDDPRTLVEVARIKLANHEHVDALALLARVQIKADRMLESEKLLLEGRALLANGQLAPAEERFRFLEGRHVGEEPRFHLATVLFSTDRRDQAIAIWHDILKRFRRAGPAWRRTEKTWYRLARQKLKDLAA